MFQPAYKLSPRLSDAYGQMVERAMERERSGDSLTGGAMTVIGPGLPSKTVDARSGALSPAAAALAGGLGPLSSSLPSGRQMAMELDAAASSHASSKISVEIIAFEPSRVPQIVQAVSLLGGKKISYSWGQSGAVRAEVERGLLAPLARVPGVMYIDRFTQAYVFNDIARWVIQSGDTQNYATPVHDHGIYGTNQTITLGDTGIDYKHPAFWDPNNTTPGPNARKLTAYYKGCSTNCDLTDNGINHGTHTSGSAAGDDGVWHVYDGDPTGSNGTKGPHDGQAFDAFLNMQDLSNDGFFIYFDNITSLWQMAVDHASWIHSNSWGSCCSDYIQEAADTDNFIWNNQDFLVVFAAGNAGSSLSTMNPFAVAKNVIAAGATVNGQGLENVADFSSRGPARDGRLKPDVMAPGVSLWSARGQDPSGDGTDYWQLSGTSMATPTTAGAATLVRQYYMDGWYPTGTKDPTDGFTPSAALIKATLINSAREMTGSGAYANGETKYPNDNQGWGRITLDDALFFQGDARGLVVDDRRTGLNTGDSVSYDLAIGDTTLPVEITLVWSDYPGTAGCSVCLVNDLDLVVTAPDGTVFRGNQYMGYNPGESRPNPGGADHLNNVEAVLVISNVQAGLWTVTVSGYDVPQGPQPYAIVMTGGIATQRGVIGMDHHHYRSTAAVNVKVIDTGPNSNPNATDTVQVNMSSTTEPTPEVITLTETGNDTSVFTGSIQLQNNATPTPGDGVLQVQNGDNITAMYFDNDNGQGGSGPVYAYAVVDDTPPSISDVRATNLRFNRATVEWATDEPSDSLLGWGTNIPPGNVTSDPRMVTSHSITLRNLNGNTTYYFYVQSTDEAGNTATDDNSSAYYHFTTPPKPPTAPPDEEWPTFHNNPPRQGISPSTMLPPLTQMWQYGPNLLQLWTGPVLRDGILFSTTLDGHIRARDPYSGTVIWDRGLGGQYYYTGTPSVDGGVVYTTFYGPSGGYVYALDELTGNTLWSVGPETGLDFNARGAMAAVDGLVFGSAWGGQIFALNEADGSLAWSYSTGDLPFGGPTVAGGVVYEGTIGGTILALDEFNGNLVWSKGLDNVITSPPLFAQGNIYVGTYSGSMYALDAFTGDQVWQQTGFGLVDMSTPAYDGASIYFGDFNNEYVALDATDGTVLWRTWIGGPVGSSVAYANGFVYATAWDGQLRVLDAFDGRIVDQHGLLAFGSTSMPAVSDGWVWIEDYYGNIYGFFGQVPVGLLLRPVSQGQDSVPDNTVRYTVNVENVGISGPDTFDATAIPGVHGWTITLYEADGVTPLPDTDNDTIPDTGPLATGQSVDVVVAVTVPADVRPGDKELSVVRFTSSNDVTVFKAEKLTTIVPPPGVSLGPRSYFPLKPGDTANATMNARNTGGFPDTIELSASSAHGWAVTLLAADGVTPLNDTDGDGLVDTGQLPGLTSAQVVVRIQVPPDAPLDIVDRTDVIAASHADPNRTAGSPVIIELAAPPSHEWPQFHHDRERGGINPVPFEMPMTQRWVTAASGYPIRWTGSVIDGHTVFVSTPQGTLLALDIGTGAILWTDKLGDSGYVSGTPAVAYGNVYVALVTNGGTTISLFAVDEETGALKWQVDQYTGFAFASFTTVAAAAGNVYWDDWYGYAIHANNAQTGAPVWTYYMPAASFQGPTYWGGMVFATDLSGDIVALDAFTGAQLWTTKAAATITSAPTVAGGVLYVGDYSGTLYAIDALSGEQIWASSGLGALFDVSSPVVAEGLVLAGSFASDYFSGLMSALDVTTGKLVWQYFMPGGAVGTSAAYDNGTVFLTTWDGNLYAWRASDGTLLQQLKLSSLGSTSSVALGDGYAIVGDEDGEITAFGFVGAGETKRVAIAPPEADVSVGGAALFQAQAYDAYDNAVGGQTFSWTDVGQLGTVLPLTASGDKIVYIAGPTAGDDTLEAATQTGFSNTAIVHILPGVLDHVDVMPGVASVVAGDTMQFTADPKDRFGNSIQGLTIGWSTSGNIGSIDASGLLTASTKVGKGTVVATVTMEVKGRTITKTGTASVEIVPGAIASISTNPARVTLEAGTTTLIQAQGYDQYGNAIPGLAYAWASTIGSITPAGSDGAAAALSAGFRAGTGTISVASQGKTLTIDVVVTPGPLNRIVLTPNPATVMAGATLQFAATPMDMFGNTISGLSLTWSASGAVGTISSSGLLTAATTVGSGSVRVTFGAISESVSVQVVAGPLASIAISVGSTATTAGSALVLSASGKDQYGNDVGAAIAWTSNLGTVLPLNGQGTLVQYNAPTTTGTATVTASSGGVTRSLTVTVAPGPVAYVIVSPSIVDRLRPGGSTKLTATATDIYGNVVAGAAVIWSASAGSIASDGTFTAPQGSGVVVITATAGGRQGQAMVFVGEPARQLTAAEQVSQPASIVSLGLAVALAVGLVVALVRNRQLKGQLEERRRRGGQQ